MKVTVTDNSREYHSALQIAAHRGLEAVGITAEAYAKKETPVDTGRLRNSMSHTVKDNAAYIGSNVEYCLPVEIGSRTNTAHHMLQMAAQNHSDEYKQLIKSSMQNA